MNDTTNDRAASGGTDAAPLLRLQRVSKSFGPVQALADVDFDIRAGEVTALVGDNGAGKSVLIKCIAGIHSPDHGELVWEGRPVRIRTPRDAALLGIDTVYQDLALCNNLDIVQNMYLGRERMHGIVMDEEAMETEAGKTLSSLAVTTVRSIRQPVASLSGGQRQSVAIATDCRWPPDSDATGWRMDRTVVTARLVSVACASFSICSSSSTMPCFRSRPRNMFCTMSRLLHSARSW